MQIGVEVTSWSHQQSRKWKKGNRLRRFAKPSNNEITFGVLRAALHTSWICSEAAELVNVGRKKKKSVSISVQ